MDFPFNEQTDMLLVLGFCEGNCRESVRVYRERYPNRRIPNHKTFARIEHRLRETGNLKPVRFNAGRPRQARTPIAEEAVLQEVDNNPRISTRRLEHEVRISKSTANRVIRDQLIHPFHVRPVQELLPLDPRSRLNFAEIVMERRVIDNEFHTKILFTDESCFTRRGMTNLHNEHVYADENPHALRSTHFQREFKINVWIGIIANSLIGPYRLPDRLDGPGYLRFLQESLLELLEDVPLNLRQNMFFMHDGAPPHFARAVREYLNEQFADRWIGRGQEAPIQ
uniref:Transposase-like protein n=1 Tax=Dichotomius schiffleri TaxID=1534479 RepID=A0A7D6C5C7_9SCAR|nr:transposase-like protein [Dichotomius schiffleri]